VNDNYGSEIYVGSAGAGSEKLSAANAGGHPRKTQTKRGQPHKGAVTNSHGRRLHGDERELEALGADGIGRPQSVLVRHGIPGAEGVALVFQFTGDNRGIPDADAVEDYWAALQERFPAAEIQASSLDDFTAEVLAKGNMAALPVITGEIGDSWLYG
jgi:hypothetical protein